MHFLLGYFEVKFLILTCSPLVVTAEWFSQAVAWILALYQQWMRFCSCSVFLSYHNLFISELFYIIFILTTWRYIMEFQWSFILYSIDDYESGAFSRCLQTIWTFSFCEELVQIFCQIFKSWLLNFVFLILFVFWRQRLC